MKNIRERIRNAISDRPDVNHESIHDFVRNALQGIEPLNTNDVIRGLMNQWNLRFKCILTMDEYKQIVQYELQKILDDE